MRLIALVLALLMQDVSSQSTVFDEPISAAYRIRGIATYRYNLPGVCCSTALNIALVDRQNPSRYWTLADLADEYEISFALERADEDSVVIAMSDPNHGNDEGRVKLFFDARSRRLLRQTRFGTPGPVSFKDNARAQEWLGLSASGVANLQEALASSRQSASSGGGGFLPAALTTPLPQSSYEEFARARPARVADGYDKEGTTIDEEIGPFVSASDGVWFGKTFYDGEGTTGVGGIGVVTATGYRLLRIPELFDWSVSALMIEPETIWIGRVLHPEGGDASGGLLEYDRRSAKAVVHDVPDVITSIARVEGALFVETTHGLYMLRGESRRRFRMEPAIDGEMMVIAETLR